MGVGHLGLAFASKKVVPSMSLGLLLVAGLFLDVVWAIAVACGVEHVRIVPGITAANALDLYDYPISHSLIAALCWSGVFAGVYWAIRKDRLGAAVLAAGVASHWVLDAVSHRPDVPVLPGGPYVGLGLWNSIPATLVVEGAILLAGVAVYVLSTRGRDRIGSFGIWALVVFFLGGLAAGYLGPPPPSVGAVVGGTAILGLPLWAADFVDRHRGAP